MAFNILRKDQELFWVFFDLENSWLDKNRDQERRWKSFQKGRFISFSENIVGDFPLILGNLYLYISKSSIEQEYNINPNHLKKHKASNLCLD